MASTDLPTSILNRQLPYDTRRITAEQAAPQTHVVASTDEIFVSIQSRLELIGRLTEQVSLSQSMSVLTSSEGMVLLMMGVSIRPSRMTKAGEPIVDPTNEKLQERSGLKRSTVYDAITTLRQKGFIRLLDDGAGRARVYAIAWLDGDEPPCVRPAGHQSDLARSESATRAPGVHQARALSGPPDGVSAQPDTPHDHEHACAPARAEAEQVKKLASAAPGEREEVKQLLLDRDVFPGAVPKLLSKCPWLTAEYIRRVDENRAARELAGEKIAKIGGWYYTAILHRYPDQQQQLRLFAASPRPALPSDLDRHEIRKRREREEQERNEAELAAGTAFVASLQPDERTQLLNEAIAAAPPNVALVWQRRGTQSPAVCVAMHKLFQERTGVAGELPVSNEAIEGAPHARVRTIPQ